MIRTCRQVLNLATGTARFVERPGLSETYPDDGGLFAKGAAAGDEIPAAYEACDFARAMRAVMALADRANEYVDQKEPWKLAKAPERAAELRDVCTVTLNLYRQLVLYLAPVLPQLAAKSAELLGAPFASWSDAAAPLAGTRIARFSHLMQRVDPKKVDALLAAHAPEPAPAAEAAGATTTRSGGVPVVAPASEDDGNALAAEPLAAEITIDDFSKIDLRVARVVQAEELPEAKKLLKLTLSLGGGVTRTVFAGIKSAYAPAELVGRLVVVVANLAPRKMKLGTSEGMVITAGPGEKRYSSSPIPER